MSCIKDVYGLLFKCGGEIMKRELYLKQLRSVMGIQIIKVLTGMRRVGKSTILKQLKEELIENGIEESKIIFINFELLQFEALKDYQKLFQHIQDQMKEEGRYYIFLDEIQEVNLFEKVINSLNAEGRAEIFITGSNSKLLSGELATYLTGRYYTLEVFPFTFKEMCAYNPDLNRDDLFLEFIRLGGMPARLQFEDENTAKNYLLDIYQSILLKDLVARYAIRDVDLLSRFMKYILQNTSQTFSATTITNFLKSEGRSLSRETIYHYLESCQNAYLIHRIQRFDIKGKELLRTSEKFFVNDLGLRGLYFDNEMDIGQSLENIVLIELLQRGYHVQIGKLGENEVDFVVTQGSSKAYIQVTYLMAEESTIEREFGVLEKITDNYPKYVISMDRIKRSRGGIKHLNIIDFLVKECQLFT